MDIDKQIEQVENIHSQEDMLIQWITKDNYESLKGVTLTDAEWKAIVEKNKDSFADMVSNLVEEEL
tara:strand:+ start:2264 stop:2461 length:198 start_codon:yes stop_codon:yes gene_type:complete